MYRKLLLTITFVAAVATGYSQLKTPQPSPSSKVEQVVGLTNFTIEYSRPSMKGRTIFGDLVPYGKLWRTGANANTKITFDNNIKIGDTEVKKGSYAIYTIPNENSWEIMLYNETNNWGNPKEWSESKVVAKATVESHKMPFDVQTFTIDINNLTNNGGSLDIMWEKTYVSLPFSVPTDEAVTKGIATIMAGPTKNDYYQAASYYFSAGKDLNQALEWMKVATEGDNPPYWYLRTMSLIQAELGDKAGAIATAKRSLDAAQKANNPDYVKMNKESIAKWQ